MTVRKTSLRIHFATSLRVTTGQRSPIAKWFLNGADPVILNPDWEKTTNEQKTLMFSHTLIFYCS